jgi:hypothetical protein
MSARAKARVPVSISKSTHDGYKHFWWNHDLQDIWPGKNM